jgi:hypothetical protein
MQRGSARTGTSWQRRSARYASDRRNDARDARDARLVADVAVAVRAWETASGRPAATKVLREAVWFFWQNPRLARPRVVDALPDDGSPEERYRRAGLDLASFRALDD